MAIAGACMQVQGPYYSMAPTASKGPVNACRGIVYHCRCMQRDSISLPVHAEVDSIREL